MPTPLPDLLRGVRDGSPDSCREFIERHSHLVLRLVRQRLSVRLQAVLGPEDVMQSVWRVFFTEEVMRREFSTPEQVLGFLLSLTRHKVSEYHRKHLDAQKRDLRQVGALPDDVPQTGPGPERLAESGDEWHALLSRYPPSVRRGLAMLRDGHSLTEVAGAVGISERHLRRVLNAARSERATRAPG